MTSLGEVAEGTEGAGQDQHVDTETHGDERRRLLTVVRRPAAGVVVGRAS